MITLRAFREADVVTLVRILNNPDVAYYLSSKIPQPYTEADALWWIQTGSLQGIVRAIDYHGELVGCVGVTPGQFEYARSGEVGYWLDQSVWGKGIVLQALSDLTEIVKAETDIVRLFATIFSGNRKSERVVEKAGYTLEGQFARAIFRHERFFDAKIFAYQLER